MLKGAIQQMSHGSRGVWTGCGWQPQYPRETFSCKESGEGERAGAGQHPPVRDQLKFEVREGRGNRLRSWNYAFTITMDGMTTVATGSNLPA